MRVVLVFVVLVLVCLFANLAYILWYSSRLQRLVRQDIEEHDIYVAKLQTIDNEFASLAEQKSPAGLELANRRLALMEKRLREVRLLEQEMRTIYPSLVLAIWSRLKK